MTMLVADELKPKSLKPKKCLILLESVTSSLSSQETGLRTLFDVCSREFHRLNPTVPCPELDEETNILKVAVERADKAVQVKGPPLPSPAACAPVAEGDRAFQPPPVERRRMKPNVFIKVEDSGSDDSNNSEENSMAEQLVSRMMVPPVAPSSTTKGGKMLLHYVLVENLPLKVTSEELATDLFRDLLEIDRDSIAGINVSQAKTESVAQVYFHNINHVRKTLTFSEKLVFKGRVITSRIGSSS